ncbi:unnamed protein product [Acanthoscelides obtectus]|uniref:Uncharacterized protein n=1 Tax=Acanthoscelides obtectus TaxID=200917 RepID=A0A9P0Q8E1_ACAOB|nr:unnamed protein product [Acanthoscelides obtectus]CAH2010471.1 unnamed protein product [Acanthoscelides obtectus]CAK1646554.1 hypothetical protein AOBTE_LOCUS14705 [Acanthoscelides obtectus]CAK1646577.1 hypothetical protein AOBTE_LOCUS14728 [Acanthoscelides obtectus]
MHLFNVKVHGYAKILEDKKADRASRAMLGTKLKKTLTPPSTAYRCAQSLIMFYEYKKKELRRKIGEEKNQRVSTGGGAMPAMKWGPEVALQITFPRLHRGLQEDRSKL